MKTTATTFNFEAFVAAYAPQQLDDGETYEAEIQGSHVLVARHGCEDDIYPLVVVLAEAADRVLTVDDVAKWSLPDVEASHVFALADGASIETRYAAGARGVRVISGVFSPSEGVWARRAPRINRYTIDTREEPENWPQIYERLEIEGEDAIMHDANGEFVASWNDLVAALPLDRPQAYIDEFESDPSAIASHRYALQGHVLALPDGPELEIDAVDFNSYWVATRSLEAQTREAAWATLVSDIAFD